MNIICWPIISYGVSRGGKQIGIGTAKAGLEQPLRYYEPGIAPSGMKFYFGERYPAWSGNLFIGSLYLATDSGRIVRIEPKDYWRRTEFLSVD